MRGNFYIRLQEDNSKEIYIMANNVGEDIKTAVNDMKRWLSLEVEYMKLTAAEKASVLVSTLILAIVLFIVFMVVLIVFAFALVDLFNLFMPHALACVTVGGILLLFLGALYLFRNPLVVNPITKLITKLFLTPKKK